MPKWSDHDIDNTGDCLPDCWCKNPSPSSSDLVERLHSWNYKAWSIDGDAQAPSALMLEAADTIQRLEAEKDRLHLEIAQRLGESASQEHYIAALQSERDRLRKALEAVTLQSNLDSAVDIARAALAGKD
jgi:hypothetical protein